MKRFQEIKYVLMLFAVIIGIIIFFPLENVNATAYKYGGTNGISKMISDLKNTSRRESVLNGSTFESSHDDMTSNSNNQLYCIATNVFDHGVRSISAYIHIDGDYATVYTYKNESVVSKGGSDSTNAKLAFILGGRYILNGSNIPSGYSRNGVFNLRQAAIWRNIESIDCFNNQSKYGKKLYNWADGNKEWWNYDSETDKNNLANFESAATAYGKSWSDGSRKEASITNESTTTTFSSSTLTNNTYGTDFKEDIDFTGAEIVKDLKFSYTGTLSSIVVTNTNGNNISSNNIKFRYKSITYTYNDFIKKYTGGTFYLINISKSYIKDITINVSTTDSDKIIADIVLLSDGDEKQPMIVTETKIKETQTDASLTYNVTNGHTAKLVIKKVDSSNANLTLNGAKFRVWVINAGWLKGTNGNYSIISGSANYSQATTYTTDSKGQISLNKLRYGTYRIFETEAPTGYDIADQTQYPYMSTKEWGRHVGDFEIKSGTTTLNVQVENKAKGKITIYKKDGNTNANLANAKITLQDSSNNYYDSNGKSKGTTKTQITIPATGITIENLPAGTYKVTEVGAPSGYSLELQTSTTITATISSSNYEQTITMKNYQYGDLQIIKKDKDTGNVVSGVKFIIKSPSGYISSYTAGTPSKLEYTSNKDQAYKFTTNSNGQINLSNIPTGTYSIYEVEGAEGFDIQGQDNYDPDNNWVDFGTVEVKTNADGAKAIVNINNNGTGSITLIKKDYDTQKNIGVAQFTLQDSQGNYYDKDGMNKGTQETIIEVDANGVTIEHLKLGTYVVKEVKSPDGYKLELQGKENINGINVTISKGENQYITKEIVNRQYGDLQITKSDIETKDLLAGAKFIIADSKGQFITIYEDGTPSTISFGERANAKEFVTDGNGEINLINIPIGTYSIYEIQGSEGYDIQGQDNYNPDQNWVEFGTIEVTTNADRAKATINLNNYRTGSISIIKKDYDTNKPIGVATFTLQNSDGDYYDKDGVNRGDKVQQIEVDAKGTTIDHLRLGTYTIKEVKTPSGYKLQLQNAENLNGINVTISRGANEDVTKEISNRQYGDIKIIKRDVETKELINGAKFIIANAEEQFITSYTKGEPSEISFGERANAKEFVVGENDNSGEINIVNIPIGKYHVYEIEGGEDYDIREQTGYNGAKYDTTNKWVDWGEVEVTTNTGDNSEPNNVKAVRDATNIKIIKISGYVWVDVPNTKANDYNSLYDGEADGVETSDANTQNSKETKIPGVTVYLKYKSNGKIHANYPNGVTTNNDGEYLFEKIKKSELDDLYVEFDYSSVENSKYKQYIPVAYNDKTEANIVDNGSRALYDEVAEKDADLTGVVSTYKGTKDEQTYGLSGILLNKLYDKAIYTLQWINLGIKQLPETSYTLQEDIVEAKIDFGGKEYTYTYGKRGNKDYEGVPVVNWQGKSDIRAYSADIYPSVIAEAVANNKDITATIKYRIDITNTTNYNIEELYVENKLMVSQIQDSFDNSRYELADSNWENPTSTSNGKSVTKMKSSYINEIYGNGIVSGETKTAYINFSIKPEAIKDILNHPNGIIEEHPTKAGALAYHEYTRKDYSWNNNITKNQTHKTMEKEETDTAPYLIFKIPTITEETSPRGYVFEDTNVRETSGEVVGNGQYEADETKLSGIQVELLDKDRNRVKLYNTVNTATEGGELVSTGDVEEETDYGSLVVVSDAIVTTNSEGKYSFVGVLPDTPYYIRFTYGDGTQKIADYKSTIVTSEKVQNLIKGNDTSKDWYKNIGGNNYSVATDDLAIRKEYNTNNDSHTTIPAETPLMEFSIETLLNDTGLDVFNFGIITLPKQELTIDKNITNIKITNTQGNIILDGNPAVDVISGVSAIVDGNATGYVRIELPEDEIYGSKLTITYEIIVTNVSDINYYETESQYEGCYYLFGDASHAQEVTTTAKEVLDYLDPALKYVSSSPDGRVTEKNASEYQTYVDKQEEHMHTEYTREEDYDKVLSITNWEQLYSNKKDGRKSADVVEIVAERTLTTEDDDMELISTAEIITPTPTPSSLIPNKVKLPEQVDAITTIMPPTGSDLQSIVIYTIAGIASLVVLAAGVIIIKKKVLK